jgi:hypothetical protein
MSSEDQRVEGMRKAVRDWIDIGLDIEMREPTPAEPHYTARMEEFGLAGTGVTREDALNDLFSSFFAFIDSVLRQQTPLPPRRSHARLSHGPSTDDDGL